MGAPKGHKKAGGRVAGTPNKATADARAAIACFVESNVGRLNGLLDDIEKHKGSQAAWDCIVSVLEYHVPKLARTEATVSGPDGGPIKQDMTVKFVD